MDVQDLLDAAKRASGQDTDSGLAKALGVTKQAVSNWRKGNKLPDTVTCATLAGLTGIPLAKVLGIIGEARAISREEKAVWRKLAATAALLAVGVLGAFPGLSQAAPGHEKAADVYIMRNKTTGMGQPARLDRSPALDPAGHKEALRNPIPGT